jgi:catechol 2,3-dioxygenase-like lactoylglutathione lyase family enzyme
MDIKFHSTVIMTNDFSKMKSFYQEILQQEIDVDFGNCISFKNGLTLWKLKDEYPIAKKLGRTYDKFGNRNLEFYFESDNFEIVVENLKQ